MPNFDQALVYVIANEGSTYTNEPGDSGGPTKYGITLGTLSSWRKTACTSDDVKNLSYLESAQIYKSWYWNACACDQILDQGIATMIFDFGVNAGTGLSQKLAQIALNEIKPTWDNGRPLIDDGDIGPKTLNALNSVSAKVFISSFLPLVQNRYIDIVLNNPSQIKFLRTWLSRSQRFLTLL